MKASIVCLALPVASLVFAARTSAAAEAARAREERVRGRAARTEAGREAEAAARPAAPAAAEDRASDVTNWALRAAAERARAPEWRKAIDAALEKKVSFEFVETPFNDALGFLRQISGVNVIVDPRMTEEDRGGRPVSLKVANMPLGSALGWVCRLADAELGIEDGAVYVHRTRGRAAELARRERQERAALAARRVPETARLRVRLPTGGEVEMTGAVLALFPGLAGELVDLALDPAESGLLVYRLAREVRRRRLDQVKGVVDAVAPGAEVTWREFPREPGGVGEGDRADEAEEAHGFVYIRHDDGKALRRAGVALRALGLGQARSLAADLGPPARWPAGRQDEAGRDEVEPDAPGPARDPDAGPRPRIDLPDGARIVSVRGDRVILSVGTGDGVRVGDRLDVRRGDRHVARVEVTSAFQDMSTARVARGRTAGAEAEELRVDDAIARPRSAEDGGRPPAAADVSF